jgi:hypothetical protein
MLTEKTTTSEAPVTTPAPRAAADLDSLTCYFEGGFVPMRDAKVSIMTHAFMYGTATFEGIRAYWNDEAGVLAEAQQLGEVGPQVGQRGQGEDPLGREHVEAGEHSAHQGVVLHRHRQPVGELVEQHQQVVPGVGADGVARQADHPLGVGVDGGLEHGVLVGEVPVHRRG